MERIKNSKTLLMLLILIVSVFILLITRVTFAYLGPLLNDGKNVDIDASADLVDDFKLEIGDPLVINATPTTLPENGTNYVSSSRATAKLRANSTNNTASKNYYLYLSISNNTFNYISGTTPEIILTIVNPDGDEVTSLGDLVYGTYNGVSGFDVTKSNGLFTIADNYEITSSSSTAYTVHDWIITLTYLNHSFDQSANYGQGLEISVDIQKEEKSIPTLANWVKEQYASQIAGSETIYYHDSNLENGAGDNSYRYSGSSSSVNNYVCFGSNEENCPDDNLYRIIGVFGSQVKLIKADYATSEMLGTGGDYKGTLSPGSSYGGTQTSISTYYWSKTNTTLTNNYLNSWEKSELNTVNLNGTFYNTFSDEWKDKIENTTWKVGGNNYSEIYSTNAQTAYQNEVLNPNESEVGATSEAYIGLMYVSDYYYGASKTYWTYPGYATSAANDYRAAIDYNWMYMGVNEWTITRSAGYSIYAFSLLSTGIISGGYAINIGTMGIRPTFYLKSEVAKIGGDGTKSSPYLLS